MYNIWQERLFEFSKIRYKTTKDKENTKKYFILNLPILVILLNKECIKFKTELDHSKAGFTTQW